MSDLSHDTSPPFWEPVGLRDEEPAFELPAQLFEQLPFAVYVCDRDGLVRRYNRRAAEL
jgi:PAS domain-containing protein